MPPSPSIKNFKLWVDPDRTKIEWGGRKRQASRNYELMLDKTLAPEFSKIAPEQSLCEYPILLDIADVLSYCSSHALSRQSLKDKNHYIEIMDIFAPERMIFDPFNPIPSPLLK